MKKYHIKARTTEPASPWQNRAEAEIREVKKLARRALRQAQVPIKFWCYALEWAAKIRSLTAHDLPFLAMRTPEERISGRTLNILNMLTSHGCNGFGTGNQRNSQKRTYNWFGGLEWHRTLVKL